MKTLTKQISITILAVIIGLFLIITLQDLTYIVIDNPSTAYFVNIVIAIWGAILGTYTLARFLKHLRPSSRGFQPPSPILYTDHELSSRERADLLVQENSKNLSRSFGPLGEHLD